jgi:hypothetical protein
MRSGLPICFGAMALLAASGAVQAGEKSVNVGVSVTVRPGFRIQTVRPNEVAVRTTGAMTYSVACGERDITVSQGVIARAQVDSSASRTDQLLKLQNYGATTGRSCILTLSW